MGNPYDDPELKPVATSRNAPTCGECKRIMRVKKSAGISTVIPGALGFDRREGTLVGLCRIHGGAQAPISIRDGMEEWLFQSVLEE